MIEKKLKALTEITIYTNLWNVEEPDRWGPDSWIPRNLELQADWWNPES
jgi:hypothetical protein